MATTSFPHARTMPVGGVKPATLGVLAIAVIAASLIWAINREPIQDARPAPTPAAVPAAPAVGGPRATPTPGLVTTLVLGTPEPQPVPMPEQVVATPQPMGEGAFAQRMPPVTVEFRAKR